MKTLFLPILFGLSLASATEPSAVSLPAHPVRSVTWSVGVTASPSLLGAMGEIVLGNAWALQVQHYAFNEFVPIFGTPSNPREHYTMTSGEIGAYLRVPHFKVGLLTGIGVADGVIHGKFIRTEPKDCGIIGFCSGPESFYEKIEGRTLVVPLKIVMGYRWENVGLAFTPQVYFHGGQSLVNVPLTLEFGLP